MALCTEDALCQEWLAELRAKGIIPPETRRVIIDIPLEGLVSIWYECNADKDIFKINLAVGITKDNPVVHVADAAKPGGAA